MRLVCHHCRRELEFAGEAPRFCGFCGKPLGSMSADAPADAEEPTLLREPAVLDQTRDFDPRQAENASGDRAEPDAIGGYKLLRRLGGGGMGAVYEAEQSSTGRRVAVKLIGREYAASKDALARFRQEGRLASQLSHPRCVFVLGVDEEGGRPYIVMELMPGSTLSDLVRKNGPLSVDEAAAKIADVIDGLCEAHRLGLVHRDVKPSNCFLQSDGRVKIGDFGLSKSLSRPGDGSGGDERHQTLTRTGAFLGTPLYAAPEQVKGEKVDQQADVYAVCATLYFLLTGQAPFEGTGDAMSVMARIVADDPKPMRTLRPHLPAALDQIVLKGLARDKRQRWRNLELLRQALSPFLPQRFGYVGLGLRAGAMVIDSLVSGILSGLSQLGLLVTMHLLVGARDMADVVLRMGLSGRLVVEMLLPTLVSVLYFGLFDWRLGCTPGKWLLGLRVRGDGAGGKPTLRQAALRTVIFAGVLNLLYFAWLLATPHPGSVEMAEEAAAAVGTPHRGAEAAQKRAPLDALASIMGAAIGTLALCSTMRRRNGYRGLHELASGTRTVASRYGWLGGVSKRNLRRAELPTETGERLPTQLGGYQVRGAYSLSPESELLVAHESSLDRSVWIWRRPAAAQRRLPARSEVSRQTRWRWLSSGQEAEQSWDAFLATPGVPLIDSIDQEGPMSWKEARPILEQLAEELAEARKDGTLPPQLSASQVWLALGGQAQLLDMPLQPNEPLEPSADTRQEEERLRRFLAAVVTLCLEGKPRRSDDFGPPRVALPRHADELLMPLLAPQGDGFSLEKLRAALAETDGAPAETARGRRFAHFCVHAFAMLLLFAALSALVFSALANLEESDAAASLEGVGALGAAHASHVAPSTASRTAPKPNAPSPSVSAAGGVQFGVSIPGGGRSVRTQPLRSDESGSRTALYLVASGLFALVCLMSYATRGGLLLAVFGLALASVHGGPLRRWRCLMRTAVVGIPVALLFLGSLKTSIDLEETVTWWRRALEWGSLAYIVSLFAAVLWKPSGTWWDFLAGARVVPR